MREVISREFIPGSRDVIYWRDTGKRSEHFTSVRGPVPSNLLGGVYFTNLLLYRVPSMS